MSKGLKGTDSLIGYRLNETTWQRIKRYHANLEDALTRKNLKDAERWEDSAGYVLSITRKSATLDKYVARHRELSRRIANELWEFES